MLPDSPEDAFFRDRGWVTEGHEADTVLMLASVAQVVAPHCPPTCHRLGWRTAGPGLVRAVVDDVAVGFAGYADDWVGFRSLEVEESHRGQGLALAVMAALVEWGAAQGATTAYLQVLGDNAPARRLYEGMGFTPHHTYRYLTPAT